MLKSLFRDSILYTLSSVLTRGITFILLPVYTRILTPEEFGLLDYFVALGAIASIIVTLEIMQGLARYIPEYLDDEKMKREYASSCLLFVIGNYSLMLVLIVTSSTRLSILLLDTPDKADLIELAAWSFWMTGVLNVLHGQLRWELRAAASTLLSLLVALLTVACTLVLVVWLQWGLRGALLAQVVGGFLALLPSLYLTRSSFSLRFSRAVLRRMLAFSVPLIPSSLAVVFALYIDRIALKEFMSLEDVGVYAVGQKISLVVTLALIGFRSALTPLVYANHSKKTTPGDLAQVFRFFCLVSLICVLSISVFAREIVEVISAEAFHEAANIVPFLVFGALLSNMYIFAPGLEIRKKTGFIALINIFTALFGVLLNYKLIPVFGIVGAAVSALLSFGVGFLVYMYASQCLYPVPHNWSELIVMLAISLAGMAFIYIIIQFYGGGFGVKFVGVLATVLLLTKAFGVSWVAVQKKMAMLNKMIAGK